jgi:uncharacterized UPF0146 family protein
MESIRRKHRHIKFLKDDILKPNYDIYRGTDLIYSIRPPIELIEYLVKISYEVNSALLIRLFSGELPSKNILDKFQIINTSHSILIFMKNG